jgi:hypothetical protein
MSISPSRLNAGIPAILLFAACAATAIFAQSPAAAGPSSGATAAGPNSGVTAAGPSVGPALAGLRPALNQVSFALSSLRIEHWKAPGDLRDSTTEDVGSIQRDLAVTLPPLLDQAQVTGAGILAPSFAIFRNIDALYDVLLRVTEMATLTGSSLEASRLEDARAALESARAELASSLLRSMTEQDSQLAHFRDQAIQAKVNKAPTAPPTKIVVDDGPAPPQHHKKKPPPPPQ